LTYKLTVVGGGSSYTPELVEGLITRRQELPLRELALVDVPAGREKAEVVAALSRRMMARAGLSTRVSVSLDRRSALEGADFVISQVRVGGLEARVLDEKIPLGYDVVGQETTGPGGFANALRTVPVALDIARDVRELAPSAWVMTFTNPAGIVTEAISRHVDGVKVIGLCNVPISIQRAICRGLDAEPWRVELDSVGLNHLGWITAVRLDGQDILPAILSLPIVEEQFVKNIPGAKGLRPLLDALGILPSPYLQYYYFGHELLAEEKEAVASGKGTRGEQVLAIERDLFARYASPELAEKPPELSKRGGAYYSEAALDVMVSLSGRAPGPAGGPRNRHIVNVPNRMGPGDGLPDPGETRVLPDLPAEAVVETACWVGPDGPRPVRVGPLPLAARGLVQQVKAYEELTIEAAVSGDRRKALLALLNHPLVPGVAAAEGLLADILAANRAHLPAFQ
jgi:6-phospho-beta-glucosidase